MFGIGMPELMVVLIIGIVVIGPKKLPELAKAVGKGYWEFQKALKDMKNSFDDVDTEINQDIYSDDDNVINERKEVKSHDDKQGKV